MKTFNRLGFTITELAVALGLMGVITASLMSVMNIMTKKQAQQENLAWVYDLRFEVTNAINDKRAFDNYTMAANNNMACVRNKTDCAGQGGPISLLDAGGRPLRLVASPDQPTSGITRRGDPCSGFGTSPDCPFRYEASWNPICSKTAGVTCKVPQVQVNTRLRVSDVARDIGIFKADLFNLRVNRIEGDLVDISQICASLGGTAEAMDRCKLSIGGPCNDPNMPYITGFDSMGNPHCSRERSNTRCADGGVLTSLNSDGTFTCVNGCAGTGAGVGYFDFGP